MIERDQVLTMPELANRWRKSDSAVYTLARNGDLPFVFYIGSSPRARLSDVIAYEESRKVKPPRKK